MKIRVPPRVVQRLAGPLVSLLARTWRIEVHGLRHWQDLRERNQGFVFVLWHESLLPLLWRHRRQHIAIVVSEAREGQYLADYAAAIGYHLVRGSSTRGGARALLGAVRALESGTTVAFTPDGPRGPRREMKPGVIAAAQRAGVPVLPIHAEARRAWRFRSWDRFMLPKPFARVRVGYGEPFTIGPGEAGLAEGMIRATRALNSIAETIAWPDDAEIRTG